MEMQILMFGFFLLILLFRWRRWCRTILALFYVGGSIYLGVNHFIEKWYIIIPISILLLFYMLWNIGGVVNCVAANKFKLFLDKVVSETQGSYDDYKDGIEKYNVRNGLGFWSKVKTKREPKWKKYEFGATGLEMFALENALLGIRTKHWERRISKVSKISSNLGDKHSALRNNESLYEEKDMISRIREKNDSFGGSTGNFDEQRSAINFQIDKSREREKKILKKRW